MAYGNWGAFVYRNGERMHNHEDQTPYCEESHQAGYHQAFGIDARVSASGDVAARPLSDAARALGVHHAVLGSGRVRFCAYKDRCRLFLDAEAVDIDQYVMQRLARPDPWEPDDVSGTIEGCAFSYVHYDDPASCALTLSEPDGTVWTARAGYMMGAGHDD